MVGHLKFSCILIGGYFLFNNNIHIFQAFGIILTMLGIFLYTHFKIQEANAPKLEKYNSSPSPEVVTINGTVGNTAEKHNVQSL